MNEKMPSDKSTFKYHLGGIFIGCVFGGVLGYLFGKPNSTIMGVLFGGVLGEIIGLVLHASLNGGQAKG